jgi:hypothetical protein
VFTTDSGGTRPVLTLFEHVEGSRVSEGLFSQYTLPNGRRVFMYCAGEAPSGAVQHDGGRGWRGILRGCCQLPQRLVARHLLLDLTSSDLLPLVPSLPLTIHTLPAHSSTLAPSLHTTMLQAAP